MSIDASEAARLYQAALEYRRTARDRLEGLYSMGDELDECDEAVVLEHDRLRLALLDREASR